MATTTPSLGKPVPKPKSEKPHSTDDVLKQDSFILKSNTRYDQIEQRLLEIDAANLLIDKNIERQTRRMATLAKAKLQLFVLLLVLAGLFVYQKYKEIVKKWKNLIDQLKAGACNQDKPHALSLTSAPFHGPALPSFVECSPFFIALCLEYPFFSSLKFANTSFPLAVKYAFTSSCYSCIMAKIDGPYYAGATHVPKIFEVSQMCTLRSNSGECNAETICCEAFKQVYMSRKVNPLLCYINPLYPDECFPTCKVDQYSNLENNSSAAATTAGIQMGTGAAFAAHQVGGSVGKGVGKMVNSGVADATKAAESAENYGNVIGSALMIGAAVGFGFWGASLQRQSVSDSQKDCQKSLVSQLCLGKSGFCQEGTDGSGGDASSALSLPQVHRRYAEQMQTSALKIQEQREAKRRRAQQVSLMGDGPDSGGGGDDETEQFDNWPVQTTPLTVPSGGQAYASCYMSMNGTETATTDVQQEVFSDPSGMAYMECCYARNSCLPKTCVGADTQMCYGDDPTLAPFISGASQTKDLHTLWDKGYQNCVMKDQNDTYYITFCDRPMVLVQKSSSSLSSVQKSSPLGGRDTAAALPDDFLTNGQGQELYCGHQAMHATSARKFICPQSFWGCDTGVIASRSSKNIVPAPNPP